MSEGRDRSNLVETEVSSQTTQEPSQLETATEVMLILVQLAPTSVSAVMQGVEVPEAVLLPHSDADLMDPSGVPQSVPQTQMESATSYN